MSKIYYISDLILFGDLFYIPPGIYSWITSVCQEERCDAGVVIGLEQCFAYPRWCQCHFIISHFIKIQNGLTFLVTAYPGCPGKEAAKWLFGVCYMCVHVKQLLHQITVSFKTTRNSSSPEPIYRTSSYGCCL